MAIGNLIFFAICLAFLIGLAVLISGKPDPEIHTKTRVVVAKPLPPKVVTKYKIRTVEKPVPEPRDDSPALAAMSAAEFKSVDIGEDVQWVLDMYGDPPDINKNNDNQILYQAYGGGKYVIYLTKCPVSSDSCNQKVRDKAWKR